MAAFYRPVDPNTLPLSTAEVLSRLTADKLLRGTHFSLVPEDRPVDEWAPKVDAIVPHPLWSDE